MAAGTKQLGYAISAFITGLVALTALALTCISVVYCITPREQARNRKRMKNRKP